MEPYWDLIKEIIRNSDIILEVLDARSVDISRNEQLEKMIRDANRPRIFVINKIDLVDKKHLELSVERLMRDIHENKIDNVDVAYVSNKRIKTIKILLRKIRQMFSKYGKRVDFRVNPIIKRPFREAKGDIIIGIVGYPNVGKSSLINSLSFKKKVAVSSKAGTTHGVHWIAANEEIKLIDTPGVIPLSYMDESKLAFIASKNAERLKEPEVAAGKIIELFIKENKLNKLEDFFNIKLDEKENPYLILEEIALKKNHLKKGGLPDDIRVSIIIIKAWQEGRLRA
jgi:ribosome biogenesis GTPase A